MNPYKIQPFLTKAVSLLTAESIFKQNLFEKLQTTTKSTILTTVEHETHTKYAEQLLKLKSNSNIKVVPYFQPLVNHHYQLEKTELENKDNPRGISLLVGNNNEQLVHQLNSSKIVTLEELCQAFPEKIPLSFRSKNNEARIVQLQNRLGCTLSREKVIHFENILLISPFIKMWDQAIQVIMDFMPTPLYVPYLKQDHPENEHYTLKITDFLNALKKIQQTMKIVVKNHSDPIIVVYNQRKQLDWMISQIAPQASSMVIDRNFFTVQPKTMEAIQNDIKIPTELQAYL